MTMSADRQLIHVKTSPSAPVVFEMKLTVDGPVLYEDKEKHRAYVLQWTAPEPGGAGGLGPLGPMQVKDNPMSDRAKVESAAMNRLLLFLTIHRLVLAGALMVLGAALALAVGLRFAGVGVAQIIAPMCLWMLGFAFIMPGVTTAALALFPRNAGSASALMGALQMGMGFVGAALCSLFTDSVAAFATVPPSVPRSFMPLPFSQRNG